MATVIWQQSQTKQTYTKHNQQRNCNKRNPTCYILSQNLHVIDINLLKANGYQSHVNFAHFSHTFTGRCTSPRRSTICIMTFSVYDSVDSVPYGWNMRNHLQHISPKRHTKPRGKRKTTQNVTSALYRINPCITRTTTFTISFNQWK